MLCARKTKGRDIRFEGVEYKGKPCKMEVRIQLYWETKRAEVALRMDLNIFDEKGECIKGYWTIFFDKFGHHEEGLDFLKSVWGNSQDKLKQDIIKWWEHYAYDGRELLAGTREQCRLVKEAGLTDYEEMCAYLKQKGKFEVEVEGQKVRYGEIWFVPQIPKDELDRIEAFIEEDDYFYREGFGEETKFISQD